MVKLMFLFPNTHSKYFSTIKCHIVTVDHFIFILSNYFNFKYNNFKCFIQTTHLHFKHLKYSTQGYRSKKK